MTSTKLQEQCVKWFRMQYRNVIINASVPDTGTHTEHTGSKQVSVGYHIGFPDLFVYKASGGYHGLAFELKRSDEKLTLRDGTASTVHIWEQYNVLKNLRNAGYPGCFIISLDNFMCAVNIYMAMGIAPELQKILQPSSAKLVKSMTPFHRHRQRARENNAAMELYNLKGV